MPNSISDVMSALEQLLLEHFKSINTGDAAEPFLAFEFGTPIPDETFRNPADASKYSPALALQYLSHRANAVPSIQDRLFVETSNTVEGLYEILLRGSTPVDAANMELLGAIKGSAASAFDQVLQDESGLSLQFRPTFCDPANWYDQTVTSNWTPIKISRNDNPPPRPAVLPQNLQRWSLAPLELRPQLAQPASLATMNSLATLQVAALAPESATNSLATMQVAGLAPKSAMRLAPAAFQRVRMTNFKLNPRVVTLGKRQPRREVALAANNDLIFAVAEPFRHSPPPPPPPPLVSGDEFSIDVEVSIVKLRRPWLSDGLLNLTNWFVPSTAKGFFSNGTGGDDPGILPVLPVACVLIRNLTVHARWSEEDRKNLENSTHLGPFGLQGRSFDHNTTDLKVVGMQSVAWICDPLPLLPPADAPA
jgi:hypothetical protein